MSTVAAGHARIRRSLAVALTDRVAIALLAGFVIVLAAATWGTWGSLDGDTGYDILAGDRIADGELPYRDFLYYYGPLSAGLHALVALAGATGVAGAMALGLVLTAAIIAATYALARMMLAPFGALLASAITAAVAFAPGNFSYVMPHSTAATLGLLAILVTLLAIGRHMQTGRLAWLIVAGAAAGASLLTKPEFAMPAIAALAVAAFLRVRVVGVRGIALVAGAAVVVPAVVYGAFLLVVSPGRLLFDNLYPVDELDAGGSAFLEARAPFTAGSFAEALGHLALYAAGVAAIWGAARLMRRGGAVRAAVIAAAVIAGLLLVALMVLNPGALRRSLEFVYGWIPAGAVVIAAALGWQGRGRERSPVEVIRLAATVALAVYAATTYATFYLHAEYESPATYIAPLAAILLVSVHVTVAGRDRGALALGVAWICFIVAAGASLAIRDARAESVGVTGPGGTLTARPADAARVQPALDALVAATRPGEPVLIAPLAPSLYILSGRSDALDQISLTPGSLPSAEAEERAIRQVDEAGVNVALIDSRELPGYGHGAFGTTYDRRLAAALEADFVRTDSFRSPATDRTIDLWTRKDSR